MGFLIFILYIAVAAAVAYGAITVIHSIRKYDREFLISYGDDYQYIASVLLGVFWPIAAPIGFAILFAYKKTVEEGKE